MDADLNLTCLLLAQKLLRQDRAAAMLRLGIGPELAGSNLVLCGFRLDELPVLRTVVQDARERALQQAHLSIVLTGALNQAAAAARWSAPSRLRQVKVACGRRRAR